MSPPAFLALAVNRHSSLRYSRDCAIYLLSWIRTAKNFISLFVTLAWEAAMAWAAAQAAAIEEAPRPVGVHIACSTASVRCSMVTESNIVLEIILLGGK